MAVCSVEKLACFGFPQRVFPEYLVFETSGVAQGGAPSTWRGVPTVHPVMVAVPSQDVDPWFVRLLQGLASRGSLFFLFVSILEGCLLVARPFHKGGVHLIGFFQPLTELNELIGVVIQRVKVLEHHMALPFAAHPKLQDVGNLIRPELGGRAADDVGRKLHKSIVDFYDPRHPCPHRHSLWLGNKPLHIVLLVAQVLGGEDVPSRSCQ